MKIFHRSGSTSKKGQGNARRFRVLCQCFCYVITAIICFITVGAIFWLHIQMKVQAHDFQQQLNRGKVKHFLSKCFDFWTKTLNFSDWGERFPFYFAPWLQIWNWRPHQFPVRYFKKCFSTDDSCRCSQKKCKKIWYFYINE